MVYWPGAGPQSRPDRTPHAAGGSRCPHATNPARRHRSPYFSPLPAGLLGQLALASVGVVVYAANVAGIGLALSALWAYAAGSRRLVENDLDARSARLLTVRALIPPAVFLISIPVGIFSPPAAVIVWWAAPVAVFVTQRIFRKGTKKKPSRARGPRDGRRSGTRRRGENRMKVRK